MSKLLKTLILLLFSPILLAQSNEESQRISELYDLLPIKNNLYGKEVLIYDYRLKNKNSIKDSSLVTQITILEPEFKASTFSYDTNGLEVIKYEHNNGTKQPVQVFKLNSEHQVLEASNVDNEMEVLSKTFYTYENDKLVSEEAYTGYAYLDEPRRLSLINYKYKDDRLYERSKKYSLNGTNWIQTWWSKYDEYGNEIMLEENEGDINITYNNEFDKGKLIKSTIHKTGEKPIIREIKYNEKGHPTSVYLYHKKKNKPIRLTRFYYQ
ncbi:hypothetical protein [Fulvivirga lutea]|uniref:YD repeat-containing protein n=1 Tax=Fulvivirga lutea TaxID=2810512 RepID=A0A974WFZ0_9BACT|nr:hypothetical protein [Fulvivirga lutea]QSE96863.1 hypothetical protein JR347_14860 [Fulvivirga lutea]